MNFAGSNPFIGSLVRDTLGGIQDARTRQSSTFAQAAIGGLGAKEEGRLMARGAAPASSSSGTDYGGILSGLGSVVRAFTPARSANLFPYGDYTNAFRGL